jgi:hypothetical protein
VSATGLKVWRIGSAVMLAGLAIWLVASRDDEGRLNESFLLVIFMVLGLRYLFGQAVVTYSRRSLRRRQRAPLRC